LQNILEQKNTPSAHRREYVRGTPPRPPDRLRATPPGRARPCEPLAPAARAPGPAEPAATATRQAASWPAGRRAPWLRVSRPRLEGHDPSNDPRRPWASHAPCQPPGTAPAGEGRALPGLGHRAHERAPPPLVPLAEQATAGSQARASGRAVGAAPLEPQATSGATQARVVGHAGHTPQEVASPLARPPAPAIRAPWQERAPGLHA